MKILCLSVLTLYILAFSFNERRRIKADSFCLDEIVKLIAFLKTEIRYKSADITSLYFSLSQRGFKYIEIHEEKIKLNKYVNKEIVKELQGFLQSLGTTDFQGQIELCEEYTSRFTDMKNEFKQKEKSKIQINIALGVMGAVTLFVFFL